MIFIPALVLIRNGLNVFQVRGCLCYFLRFSSQNFETSSFFELLHSDY